MSVSETIDSIVGYISFITETAEWHFIELIASELMVATSDCLHGMMYLFVIK